MSNAMNVVTPRRLTPDLELLRQIEAGDLSKTEEVYKKSGILYERPPGQRKKERFLGQVTNPNTGEFLQPDALSSNNQIVGPSSTLVVHFSRELCFQRHLITIPQISRKYMYYTPKN